MRNYLFLALVLLSFGLFAQNVSEEGKMTFQGSLFQNGEPFNGNTELTFSMPLRDGTNWTETLSGVNVANGLYSVILGNQVPIPIDLFLDASERVITVTVDGTTLGSVTIYPSFVPGVLDVDSVWANGIDIGTEDVDNIILRQDGSATFTGTVDVAAITINGAPLEIGLPDNITADTVSTDLFIVGDQKAGIDKDGNALFEGDVEVSGYVNADSLYANGIDVGTETEDNIRLKQDGSADFAGTVRVDRRSDAAAENFQFGVLAKSNGEGTGIHYGVRGEAVDAPNASGVIGLRGLGNGTSKYVHGVLATASGAGNGDEGDGFGEGSINFGVEAIATGNNWGNTGIEARADGDVGTVFRGVNGLSFGGTDDTDRNYGVSGFANGAGTNYGVYGAADGGVESWAGYFEGDLRITGNLIVDGSVPAGDIASVPDGGSLVINNAGGTETIRLEGETGTASFDNLDVNGGQFNVNYGDGTNFVKADPNTSSGRFTVFSPAGTQAARIFSSGGNFGRFRLYSPNGENDTRLELGVNSNEGGYAEFLDAGLNTTVNVNGEDGSVRSILSYSKFLQVDNENDVPNFIAGTRDFIPGNDTGLGYMAIVGNVFDPGISAHRAVSGINSFNNGTEQYSEFYQDVTANDASYTKSASLLGYDEANQVGFLELYSPDGQNGNARIDGLGDAYFAGNLTVDGNINGNLGINDLSFTGTDQKSATLNGDTYRLDDGSNGDFMEVTDDYLRLRRNGDAASSVFLSNRSFGSDFTRLQITSHDEGTGAALSTNYFGSFPTGGVITMQNGNAAQTITVQADSARADFANPNGGAVSFGAIDRGSDPAVGGTLPYLFMFGDDGGDAPFDVRVEDNGTGDYARISMPGPSGNSVFISALDGSGYFSGDLTVDGNINGNITPINGNEFNVNYGDGTNFVKADPNTSSGRFTVFSPAGTQAARIFSSGGNFGRFRLYSPNGENDTRLELGVNSNEGGYAQFLDAGLNTTVNVNGEDGSVRSLLSYSKFLQVDNENDVPNFIAGTRDFVPGNDSGLGYMAIVGNVFDPNISAHRAVSGINSFNNGTEQYSELYQDVTANDASYTKSASLLGYDEVNQVGFLELYSSDGQNGNVKIDGMGAGFFSGQVDLGDFDGGNGVRLNEGGNSNVSATGGISAGLELTVGDYFGGNGLFVNGSNGNVQTTGAIEAGDPGDNGVFISGGSPSITIISGGTGVDDGTQTVGIDGSGNANFAGELIVGDFFGVNPGVQINTGDIEAQGNINGATLSANDGFTSSSDSRLKQNVNTIENALVNTQKLRGVTYEWNKTAAKRSSVEEGDKKIGLIAQEVEEIFPELVKTGKDGYKSVDYVSLTAVLIEAIKELNAEVQILKTENAELKAEASKTAELSKRIETIEKLLELQVGSSTSSAKN